MPAVPALVGARTWDSAVDAHGSCVAFVSSSADLVPGDTNGAADVFVRNVAAGVTMRVSVASDGSQASAAIDGCGPSVSADCRYVAFVSAASNLVPDDTNGVSDVFVHDMLTQVTTRVSLFAGGTQGTRQYACPSLSADGRFVAFDSALEPWPSGSRVYLHDRETEATTTVPMPSSADARRAAVSGNGRYVVFMSYLRGSVPGEVYDDRVWLFDRDTGTTRSIAQAGDYSDTIDAAGRPAISADGRSVLFASSRPLVPGDTNHDFDVYLFDTVSNDLRLVSARDDGGSGHGLSAPGSVSADGRFLAFHSSASDVGPAGATGSFDVLIEDRFTGRLTRPAAGTGVSRFTPAISGDGRLLAFLAYATSAGGEDPDLFELSLDSDGDTMSDDWERFFGLNPLDPGDGPTDADGDAQSNAEEFARGTHPRGLFSRYLAEGATGQFFSTSLALGNPNPVAATAHLAFQRADGTTVFRSLLLEGGGSRTLDAGAIPGLGTAEFSTRVDSDAALVVERTMTWDRRAYGGHAETSVGAPGLVWYLAEGATHSRFDLFYLLQNPGTAVSDVEVTFLLPAPAVPFVRRVLVPPTTRLTLWVDYLDSRLASTDVSAVVRVTNGVPILVERAMYLSRAGQFFAAGHAGAAVATPATTWFLAEGATGPYFDLFILIANPGNDEARLRVSYLLPDGRTLHRELSVAPASRHTIWVDAEGPELADTAVSTLITSLNGIPVVVERSLWWPGPTAAQWSEAHVAAGATHAAHRWALPSSDVFERRGANAFVLLANTSPVAASALVTVLMADGTTAQRTYGLAPNSRTNAWMDHDFPQARGRTFLTLVESDAELVVERAQYWDADGISWAGGTCARATPVPESYSDENAFVAATSATHRASFDALDDGTAAATLALDDVTVELTSSVAAVIAPAGSYGLGFTTKFLSADVADNGNNVVIAFPEGTAAAGIHLAASGATVTVTDAEGGGLTVVSEAGGIGFVGFRTSAGLRSLRISAPTSALGTLVANLGDIVYAREE